ncbi:MAG: hypothetical protein HY824_07105 [Acidobacteria bacterium]|nr:hypothetical protein [Acidobacteriota bacterium]
MNLQSRSLRIVALALIVLGVGAAIGNIVFVPGPRLALALAIDAGFVVIGTWLWTGRRRAPATASDSTGPATSATARALPVRTEQEAAAGYGLVLVLCDESARSPLYEQAHHAILRHVAATPGRPLAPDARILDVWAPSLPRDDRATLEPVVWSLQQKFARRGGAWHADFHDPLGQPFVVVYLA